MPKKSRGSYASLEATNTTTVTHNNRLTALLDFVRDYQVSKQQKGKTRKVKPIWIYWNKRQRVAVASAWPYANLHLDPDTTMPASHHSVFLQAGCHKVSSFITAHQHIIGYSVPY